MPLILLSVGQPHPTIPATAPDGVRFSVGPGGVEIVALLPNLSKSEARAWAKGRLRLALLPAGTHTFFMCFDIDGFGRWSDAPFALGLVPVECRGLPPRKPAEGFVVRLLLIESGSKVIRAMRFVTVSGKFSAGIEALYAGQEAALDEFSARAHDAEIEKAYRRYPTATEMARAAMVIEVAGRVHGV